MHQYVYGRSPLRGGGGGTCMTKHTVFTSNCEPPCSRNHDVCRAAVSICPFERTRSDIKLIIYIPAKPLVIHSTLVEPPIRYSLSSKFVRSIVDVRTQFSANKGIELLVLVIAWFGGQLQINFLSKILKFSCNCLSLVWNVIYAKLFCEIIDAMIIISKSFVLLHLFTFCESHYKTSKNNPFEILIGGFPL